MRGVCAAMLASVWLTWPCAAEHAPDESRLRITKSESRLHVELLRLDDLYRDAVLALHEGYVREFDQAVAAVDGVLLWHWRVAPESIRIIRVGDDSYARQRAVYRLWQRSARELEQKYFDRLAALAPIHADLVEHLRLSRIRQRVLTQAVDENLDAAGCGDLVAIIDELTLTDDERDRVRPLILAYEQQMAPKVAALDMHRTNRIDRLRSRIGRIREVAEDDRAPDDPSKLADLDAEVDRAMTVLMEPIGLYSRCRSVNRAFVSSVESHLSESTLERWMARSSRLLLGMEAIDRDVHRLLDRLFAADGLTSTRRALAERSKAELESAWTRAAETVAPLQRHLTALDTIERHGRAYYVYYAQRCMGQEPMWVDDLEPTRELLDRATNEWRATVDAIRERLVAEFGPFEEQSAEALP